jgi:hypothetical protein
MANKAGLYEYKIPLGIQYRFASNWKSLKSIAVNMVKPFYKNHIDKGTCLYFKKRT